MAPYEQTNGIYPERRGNIYLLKVKTVAWESERESDRQGTAKIWYFQIYTRLRCISREPCFFMLLLWENNTGPAFNLELSGLPPSRLVPIGMTAHCWLTALSSGLKTFIVIHFLDIYVILPMKFTWYICCPLLTLTLSCTSCFEIHKQTCLLKINM